MPNVRCHRCGGIAYVTRKMLTGHPDIGDGTTISEEIRLCTICRSKADKENAAARERRMS